MMLYSIVRETKPAVVLETGVASGRSSTAILAAIEKNGLGRLYSVDLPQFYSGDKPDVEINKEGRAQMIGYVPEGKKPGWLAPERLRVNWELILGDSKIKLPELLNRLDAVDIFYHDSDHSHDHMDFEFKLMWPHIPKGGYFLSDDISWNEAWNDFMKGKTVAFIDSYRNLGIVKK